MDIEEIVEDCGSCRETLCRKSSNPLGGLEEGKVCQWNDYSGSCVAATKVRVAHSRSEIDVLLFMAQGRL